MTRAKYRGTPTATKLHRSPPTTVDDSTNRRSVDRCNCNDCGASIYLLFQWAPNGRGSESAGPALPLGDWRVMNVHRVITKVETTCWSEPSGYWIQVDTTYVESDLSGGRLKVDTVRYDRMTLEECRDVLEVVSSGPLPGEECAEQMAMFTLT